VVDDALDPHELLPPPEPVHLLDPDGTYHEDPDHPLDLDDAQLRELYRLMVVTRKVDREAINLQRQGQLGVYASCMGQEAAQVGIRLRAGRGRLDLPVVPRARGRPGP
jgi:2-oxoisovalerate dehydrogenase E1 component alpha subunit